MRETVSEEKNYATQEKYEQNEGAGAASFLDGIGNQRVIVDLWQLLLIVGHVGGLGWPSLSSAILRPADPRKGRKYPAVLAEFSLFKRRAGHFPEASRTSMIGTDCPGLTTC